jgi:hypothetical protein
VYSQVYRNHKNLKRRRASAAIADIDFDGMSDAEGEDE